MNEEETRIRHEEQLRLLGIAHMMLGGFTGLYALLALGWVFAAAGMRLELLQGFFPSDDWYTGTTMLALSAIFLVLTTVSGLNLLAGWRMRQARSRTLCVWVAVLNCFVFPPLGTAFGVFTLVVLSRENIKSMFEA